MPLPQFSDESGSSGESLPNVPVELAQEPITPNQGMFAAVKQGAAESLMGTGITFLKGKLGDQTPVAPDVARKEMQAFGYDANVLPRGPISRGYLDAIKEQQQAIKTNEFVADQAGYTHSTGIMPSVHGMSEMIGGNVADSPLFLVSGGAMGVGIKALAGEALESGAIGLAGRMAIRGGEGAGLMGAHDALQMHVGTAQGDRDISLYQVGLDMALGGALGSIGGVARPRGPNLSADEVVKLERTTEYAKAHGNMNPDEVVSRAGAVGLHQVEPSTAKLTAEELKDPAVNAAAANRILDENARRFPNDPEAQAIAYNAGPGTAEKWLKAGRDDTVLKPETVGYIARFRTMRGPANALTIRDEHDAHVSETMTASFADAKAGLTKALIDFSNDNIATNRPASFAAAKEADMIGRTFQASARPALQTPEPEAAAPAVTARSTVPEVEQIQTQASQAIADAKAAHMAAHGLEADMAPFEKHIADAVERVTPEAEMSNAVKAALECAAVKGFE